MKLFDLNGIFILLILCITIERIYNLKKYNKYNEEGEISNFLSTLGVLGTFIGISIGLFGFDANNLNESVPALLDGMKTAFVTSIIGMIGSLAVKLISKRNRKLEEDNTDDIIELFQNMITVNKDLNTTLEKNQLDTREMFLEVLKDMKTEQAISQQELRREIMDLNTSLVSKQDDLINEFKLFTDHMTKNNTDALIEALSSIINDFNNKISDQLGENFKELNHSITNLLRWQENYKITVEKSTQTLGILLSSIKQVEGSITNISDSTKIILENNTQLERVLSDIDQNQNNIKDGLVLFTNISKNANESIPMINTYFENANENIVKTIGLIKNSNEVLYDEINKSNKLFKDDVNAYLNEFNSLTVELKNTIPEINSYLIKTKDEFNKSLLDFNDQIVSILQSATNTTNNIENELKLTMENSTARLKDITTATSEQITTLINDSNNAFKDKVNLLDRTLEDELKKSLHSLGDQLATISNKFSKDYTPLAEKLKEVVRIAERIK